MILVFFRIVFRPKNRVSKPHNISRAKYLEWVIMTQVSRDQVAELSFKEPYLHPSSSQKSLHNSSPRISPLRSTPYSGKALGSTTFSFRRTRWSSGIKQNKEAFRGKMQKWSWSNKNQQLQGQGTVASLKYFFLCFCFFGSQAIDRGRVHWLLTLTQQSESTREGIKQTLGPQWGFALRLPPCPGLLWEDSSGCWLLPVGNRSYFSLASPPSTCTSWRQWHFDRLTVVSCSKENTFRVDAHPLFYHCKETEQAAGC